MLYLTNGNHGEHQMDLLFLVKPQDRRTGEQSVLMVEPL